MIIDKLENTNSLIERMNIENEYIDSLVKEYDKKNYSKSDIIQMIQECKDSVKYNFECWRETCKLIDSSYKQSLEIKNHKNRKMYFNLITEEKLRWKALEKALNNK